MKKPMLTLSTILSILVLLTCFNGGMGDTNGTQYPDIDFYGTLTDYQGTEDVHFISIARRTNNIDFYGVPNTLHSDLDPTRNKTSIDLTELKSISAVSPQNPTASQLDINGRKFVKVKLTFTTGKTQEYIIQSTRTLECVIIHKDKEHSVYQDRKLQLLHIKHLEIKGYKKHTQEKTTPDYHAQQKTKEHKKILDNFEKIHDKVKNLPEDNPSLLKQAKHVILNLLKMLREQVQGLLDSLKT